MVADCSSHCDSHVCKRLPLATVSKGEQKEEATMQGIKANGVCNFFRKPLKDKNIRKRRALEEEDGENEDAKIENKLRFSSEPLKRLKVSEVEKSKTSIFEYESSKEIQVHNDSRATAILETETEFSRDARAIREISSKPNRIWKGRLRVMVRRSYIKDYMGTLITKLVFGES